MTVSTPPSWAADLIELLERQHRIYDQLRELSERQSQFVAEGQAEPLLTLLAQRQQLIDELTRINARIEPFRRDWPRLWSQLDRDGRTRVRSLIDGVRQLLDRIMAQDEKDREALAGQREQVGSRVRRVSAGSAVHRAYGRSASDPQRHRYTDQQG